MDSLILAVLLVLVYFVPWLIATGRSHKNTGAIAALNLLLGWTLLGWIAALVWSLTDNVEKSEAKA